VSEQPGIRIGQLLKLRRLALGLTLKELSEKSGVHFSNISRLEKGDRRATTDFLIKIAPPLGYSRYELLAMAGLLSDEEEIREVVSE